MRLRTNRRNLIVTGKRLELRNDLPYLFSPAQTTLTKRGHPHNMPCFSTTVAPIEFGHEVYLLGAENVTGRFTGPLKKRGLTDDSRSVRAQVLINGNNGRART